MGSEVNSVCREQFGARDEAEGFSRTGIQLLGNGIAFILSEGAQVRSLGKVMTERTVVGFVDATRPWAVCIGNVNDLAGGQGQARGLRHRLALTVSQQKALLRFYAIGNQAGPLKVGSALQSQFEAAR